MYLNKEKLIEIFMKYSNGNYHDFARKLGLHVAQVHRVIKKDSQAGPKFLGNLKEFCDNNNLNFNDFITFKKVNRDTKLCKNMTLEQRVEELEEKVAELELRLQKQTDEINKTIK